MRESPPNNGFTFDDLIAPIAVAEFLDRYWERKYLFISRKDPLYYKALFSLSDVDRLIFLLKDSPRDLLTLIPPPGSGRKALRRPLAEISMDQVYSAFHSGDTIRLIGIQGSWPPLTALARNLTRAFGARFNMNVYMTPAESQGFPVHADTHDGFIVQVDGAKEWFLYEPNYELPIEGLTYENHISIPGKTQIREDNVRFVEQVRLEKGDLLYIPRGVPHKAIACDSTSLHVTVGVHPLHWVDFLKAAVEDLSIERPELRQSITSGFQNGAARNRMAETFESLLSVVGEGASFERTLEILSQSRPPGDPEGESTLGLTRRLLREGLP